VSNRHFTSGQIGGPLEGARDRQAPSETLGAYWIILHHWKERWKKTAKPNIDERHIAYEEPAPSWLLLHKHLRKAESSLLV
jgi:hypothetical protein